MSEFKFTELQEKWLKALELGEYRQCKELLYDGSGYCCLGVACDLADIDPEWMGERFCFAGEDFEAPSEIWQSLMLRGSLGELQEDERVFVDPKIEDGDRIACSSLAELNDAGMTFAEIAAFIRANPEKIFTGGAE